MTSLAIYGAKEGRKGGGFNPSFDTLLEGSEEATIAHHLQKLLPISLVRVTFWAFEVHFWALGLGSPLVVLGNRDQLVLRRVP